METNSLLARAASFSSRSFPLKDKGNVESNAVAKQVEVQGGGNEEKRSNQIAERYSREQKVLQVMMAIENEHPSSQLFNLLYEWVS